jgi:hypothetical protein
LAVPDWDLGARLPKIELADLAGPIDRALKRPGRRCGQRPDLAEIVVVDGPRRRAPQRRQQLSNADAGQLRVLA